MYIETFNNFCVKLSDTIYTECISEHKHAIMSGGTMLGVYRREDDCKKAYESLLNAIKSDKNFFKMPKDTYKQKEAFIKVSLNDLTSSKGTIECSNCGCILNEFPNDFKFLSNCKGFTVSLFLKGIIKGYNKKSCPKCDAIFRNDKQENYKCIFD